MDTSRRSGAVLAVFALRLPAVPEGMTPETQTMIPTEKIPFTQNVSNTAPTGTSGEAKPDGGYGKTTEFPLQLAFSVHNALLADDYMCVTMETEAVFKELGIPEGFCHGIFGESYYGGVTYVYTIDNWAPGESASITVTECVLGVAEVVRVAVKEEK